MSAGPTAEDHAALLARVADLERGQGELHYLHTAARRLRADVDDLRADLGKVEARWGEGHEGPAHNLPPAWHPGRLDDCQVPGCRDREPD